MRQLTIDGILLNTREVSFYLSVSLNSVRNWCRSGILRSEQDKKNTNWIIPGSALAEFLYWNPVYRMAFEEKRLNGAYKIVRHVILQDIYQRPDKMYTIESLADIFNLDKGTVRAWINHQGLNTISDRRSLSTLLIRAVDVLIFFDENPYYKKTYAPYLDPLFDQWKAS